MNCNKYSGGIFKKKGYTLEQRKILFYTICIFVRLLLAGIVYHFSEKKELQYLLLITSFASIITINNKINEGGCVWWNRHFHLFISIVLFICSILAIKNKLKNKKYLSYLFYLDVLFGLTNSFSAYNKLSNN